MATTATAIADLKAREVLDSRGRPTVEVELHTAGGAVGRAIAPSGASTGSAEAVELRDGEPGRYAGLGVRRAVAGVHERIAPALRDVDAGDQSAVDRRLIELDATPNKQQLGANATLAVSLAAAHAAAAAQGVPLYRHIDRLAQSLGLIAPEAPWRMPLPMTNMISGGLHAGRKMAFQDVLIEPRLAGTFAERLEAIVRVYRALADTIRQVGLEADLVGDEGGYGPAVRDHEQAIELVLAAAIAAGLMPGEEVSLALDVAASHFYDDGRYHLQAAGLAELDADGMIDHLAQLVDRFPIRSLEDGLAEDDWQGWQRLSQRLGNRVQLVGDDLFATNPSRVSRGISLGVANAVLIKPNQIGTLWETLDTMRLARAAGYALVVSARSGETEDTTIADLAVGTRAEQIKIGSVARSERLAKYNQLLRIAEQLGL